MKRTNDFEIILLIVITLLITTIILNARKVDKQSVKLVEYENIESGWEERTEKAFLDGLNIGESLGRLPLYQEKPDYFERKDRLYALAYKIWADTTLTNLDKSAMMFNKGKIIWTRK